MYNMVQRGSLLAFSLMMLAVIPAGAQLVEFNIFYRNDSLIVPARLSNCDATVPYEAPWVRGFWPETFDSCIVVELVKAVNYRQILIFADSCDAFGCWIAPEVRTTSTRPFILSDLTDEPGEVNGMVVNLLNTCTQEMETDTLFYYVRDESAPRVRCPDTLALVLPESGSIAVDLEMIDLGSSDNCTIVSRRLRRRVMPAQAANFDVNNNGVVFGDELDSLGYTIWMNASPFFCEDIGLLTPMDLQVTDANGLSTFCRTEVMLQEATPEPVCRPAFTFDPGDALQDSLFLNDLITAFQLSCPQSAGVTNPEFAIATHPDSIVWGTTFFPVNCALDDTTLNLTVYVRGADAQIKSCQTPVTISYANKAPCTNAFPEVVEITGTIKTANGREMEGVTIVAIDSLGGRTEVLTNADGAFVLPDLLVGMDYRIVVFNPRDPNDGLSVLDIIKVLRHSTGIAPLTKVAEFIAADINQSGTVSVSDIIAIQRLILGLNEGGGEWIFFPEDYVFGSSVLNNTFTVENLQEPLSLNLLAVRRGDVSLDAVNN